MRARTALPLLTAAVLASTPAPALERLYIVRHAEKVAEWPADRSSQQWPLSEQGRRRAAALASRLGEAGIAAVYTSDTVRAVDTGKPLAEAAGIPLIADNDTIAPGRMERFFTRLDGEHLGDHAVLIVGHSNTIPALLRTLGADRACDTELDIRHTDEGRLLIGGYDDLWVVEWPARGCDGTRREEFRLEP